MKKTLFTTIVLMCVLLLLSACGKAPETPPASDPTPSSVSETAPTSVPASEPTAAPAETPEPAPDSPAFDEEKFNAALALKGEDVALLFEAIGEPLETYYAPSCMVSSPDDDAEDGELVYEGFYVVSFRKDGKEIVWDVISDVG